jgi:hypothetical protein
VARRGHRRRLTLAVRLPGEPSRVSPACGVQAYARVVPLPRRPTPQARAPQQAEGAPQTHPVGRRQHACIPRRWRYPRVSRRSRTPRRLPVPGRWPPCASAGRPMGGRYPRRCHVWTTALVGLLWCARRWSACAMGARRGASTGSLATRRRAWPAHRPSKACWLRSAAARVSRSYASSGPWGSVRQTTCCCRGTGGWPRMHGPRAASGLDGASALRPRAVQSMGAVGPPLGSAMGPRTREVGRPARSSSRTKPAWCARAVPGAGTTAGRLVRSVAASPTRAR